MPNTNTLNDNFTMGGTHRAGECYHLKHIVSIPFSMEVSLISFVCQFCCIMVLISNFTVATSITRNTALPRSSELTLCILWGSCNETLVFCVVFCGPLYLLFVFFSYNCVYCLSSFDLRLLITVWYLCYLFSSTFFCIYNYIRKFELMLYLLKYDIL